jgi:hypothetical protein
MSVRAYDYFLPAGTRFVTDNGLRFATILHVSREGQTYKEIDNLDSFTDGAMEFKHSISRLLFGVRILFNNPGNPDGEKIHIVAKFE